MLSYASTGNNVMARNYGSDPKWESAVVVERTGPLSYTVQLNSGRIWRRHIDQLRDGVSDTTQDVEDVLVRNTGPQESHRPVQEFSNQPETVETEPVNSQDPPETQENAGDSSTDQPASQVSHEPERRYPSRVRQQPQRYM